MKVLLTGGTGFVGINIAEKLLDEGIDVVIYGLHSLPEEVERAFQKSRGTHVFVQGDILDQNLLDSTIKKYNLTAVIHGAAITPDVEREIKDGRTIVNVNCMGTVEVLEAARKNNIEKFIHLSTQAVYGRTALENDILIEDSSNLKPEELYDITKFAAERIAIRYKQLLDMNIVVARMGDIFGPWEYYSGVRDVMSAPFQVSQLAISAKKALLPRSGYKRWVYSRDIATSLFALLKSDSLKHDVYNVSSRHYWSVEEWCKLLEEKYPSFSYEIVKNPEEANVTFRPDFAPLQIDRLVEDTQYVPPFDLKKSFEDYNEWLEKNSIFLSAK
ncbi:NAD(P)-dependent oxidoreductase [Peribacillus cavernae]|uniref:NAD(P)-dependent oxidoreductase n=1 Tax=Peribacillus cavernae TaxID=1674310 RepID=A0A433HBS5_9BACI|nr:NAD(P)-dependent oxidoreductase [Peribacillus cavernae]MDQ0221397.1 nucleoside-diphosphate-sugar epimerase [Peribacillus cavernae]RUQ25791.1 NAD(P)-dependent oxidoreductase [Peribacillus cavernae]